jgi:NAD(P) transhydrogenase subunit alpha
LAVAIAVTRERREGETRCAVTPETVKKFVGLGATVTVEAGTGAGSSFPDAEYVAAGATVKPDTRAVLEGADIVLKVRGPTAQEISALKPGAVVVALLDAYREKDTVRPWPAPTPPPSPWSSCPGSPGPRSWTPCRPRPTSPATAP